MCCAAGCTLPPPAEQRESALSGGSAPTAPTAAPPPPPPPSCRAETEAQPGAESLTLQGLYDTFPVVLEHSGDRGRYLCASRDVAAGELVYRVRMALPPLRSSHSLPVLRVGSMCLGAERLNRRSVCRATPLRRWCTTNTCARIATRASRRCLLTNGACLSLRWQPPPCEHLSSKHTSD